MDCPKCKYPTNKNGRKLGKQRYKCKMCNYQFTRIDKAIANERLSIEQKISILLTKGKKSSRLIAKDVGVSHTKVLQIVKNPWTAFTDELIIQNIADKSKLKFTTIISKNDNFDINHLTKNIVILNVQGFFIVFQFTI